MIIQISVSRTGTTNVGKTNLFGGVDWFGLIQSFKRTADCLAVDPIESSDDTFSNPFAVPIPVLPPVQKESSGICVELSSWPAKYTHIHARSFPLVGVR